MDFLTWLKQNGKCLLISGPQGCGKTLLVQGLTDKTSTVWLAPHDLKNGLNTWWSESVKYVILDEFSNKDIDTIKPYISSRTMLVEKQGKNSIEVDTPLFILCTSSSINLPKTQRRFHILEFRA